MIHLGISGGGTKIGGLFGVAEVLMLQHGRKFDVISGISSGAVLALPLALGLFDEVRELVVNYTHKQFFKKSPITKKGKISVSAILKLIRFKPYLGDQSQLITTLGKIVSRELFEKYKKGKYADIYVGSVDILSGSKVYPNLKHLDYEDALQAVLASASIPIFTKGVRTKDRWYFDGGLRDHSPTSYVLENIEGITESVSVYSRPKDYKVFIDPPKNFIQLLMRVIDVMNIELSKSDEQREDEICLRKGIKQKKHYLPSIMKSVYDVDQRRLRAVYQAGLQVGRETFKWIA